MALARLSQRRGIGTFRGLRGIRAIAKMPAASRWQHRQAFIVRFERNPTVSNQDLTRRRFLASVAMAVPASAVLANVAAAQQPLPKLDPNDPSAKALYYVEDHTKVDKKNPLAARYAPDQNCASCSQLQGKAGEAYRPCAIFPGKLVSANGWCSVWAKKA